MKNKGQNFIDVMMAWRVVASQHHLSKEQLVSAAAQFAGLSVADLALDSDGTVKTLDVASRAMTTACVGRIAVRQGFGRPVKERDQ